MWRSRKSPATSTRLRDQGGFGLVEALVAAFVLIIGVAAAITIFASSGHAGATAERHQAAVALAQEEIERIRSLLYEEIGLVGLEYPGSLGDELPNPGRRVMGTNYVPAGASGPHLPVERLVVSDAGRSFSLLPYETRQMQSRSGTETAHIFRFVTWRDEECPLLDLGDLNISLSRLGGMITSLLGNLEVSLAGQGLISTAQSSKNTLLALNGVTNPVLAQVDNLLALIDQLLAPATQLVNEVLTPLRAPLEQALARLTGQLDFCDIDLSTLQRLETVNAALESLQGPLEQLTSAELSQAGSSIDQATSSAVNAAQQQAFCRNNPLHLGCLVGGLLGQLVNTLAGLLDSVASILTGSGPSNPGVIDKIESVPPDMNGAVEAATGGALTDVGQIPTLLDEVLAGLGNDGDENSKRVVVAVVLEHGGPAGPRQPIWMSTVITDPNTGLLMR